MKMKRLLSVIMCVMMLSMVLPAAAEGSQTVINVSGPAELRAALENHAGAHVRLTKDITFTKDNAADHYTGVYPGEGCYTIDLNGFTIKYHYMTGGEFSDQATPIMISQSKLVVINGPGTLIGGTHGLEMQNQFGSLIINGGTFKGVMGYGIRVTGGILYMNDGTVTGNFGGIEYDNGILCLNGGSVQSIQQNRMASNDNQKYGVIKNGVFTGITTLEDTVLIVPDLTIAKGSTINVIRGGGLVVKNKFVNNGTFNYESGLLSIGGEALISKDFQVTLHQDVTFSTLSIKDRGRLHIENGATVTVTDAFSSEQNTSVRTENGFLKLLGTVDHKGHSDDEPGPANNPENPGRSFIRENIAARRLKALGLFQGVGVNPDGSTNFDLERAPSRVEALVMLVRLLGKKNEAENGNWKHPFTDVPAWADSYVGYAYEKGLTNGSSPTLFGTGTATSQMYLTFVLRALGYSDAEGGDFKWDQPEDTAQKAGLLSHHIHFDDFLRSDVVLISEAALNANLKGSENTLFDKLIAEKAVVKPDNSKLVNFLSSPGADVVSLTQDITIDMSELLLLGDKEIILNDYSLTLTGSYRIANEYTLTVVPGQGHLMGAFDMSNLHFDLSKIPSVFPDEVPLIIIQPNVLIGLPVLDDNIRANETSDRMTIITYMK